MKNKLLLGILCFLLSACSPALMPPETEFANASKVVCKEVVPVGSHLKERVCTTVAASAEESQQAKQVLADAQQRLRDDIMMERASRRAPRGP
jgi:Skp family chaperone for outer membrane proteins